MKKKVIGVLLAVMLLVVDYSFSNVNYNAKAATKTKHYFTIDDSQFDIYWYPSDTIAVYGNIDRGSKKQVIGYIFLVCGIAIDKTDRTQQTMMIMTETQPLFDYKSVNDQYYYDTLNDYVSATLFFNSDVQDNATYFPVAATKTATSTTGGSVQIEIGAKDKISGSIGLSHSCSTTEGGIDIQVVKNNTLNYRTLKYDYRMQTGFWVFGSSINVALANSFIQTFSFEYTYRGNNTAPLNHIEINAGFKAGRHLNKPGHSYSGNGAAMVSTGNDFKYSFYLGGF